MFLKLSKSLRHFKSSKYDVFKVEGFEIPIHFNQNVDNENLMEMTREEEWDNHLEQNEVEARVYKHLKHFDININTFSMQDTFNKFNFDEYEQINFLTTLE